MSADNCFVDTNILIYAADSSDARRHEIAKLLVEDLWRTQTGVISTQVLQEFCYNLRRKFRPPLSLADTVEQVSNYLTWPTVTNTVESVIAALELEAEHQLSFWDALIVRAAQVSQSNILYTEDLNHGHIFGSVRVVNPFLEA